MRRRAGALLLIALLLCHAPCLSAVCAAEALDDAGAFEGVLVASGAVEPGVAEAEAQDLPETDGDAPRAPEEALTEDADAEAPQPEEAPAADVDAEISAPEEAPAADASEPEESPALDADAVQADSASVEAAAAEMDLPEEAADIGDAPAPELSAKAVSDAPADQPAQYEAGAPAEITIGVKQKHKLSVTGVAPGAKLTYKSLNKRVAKVSRKGVVTGKRAGVARVDCYANGALAGQFTIHVLPAPRRVSLGVKKLTLGIGETVQLTPAIPAGTHASFRYSSSKKRVASVSKTGVVTGRKKGKAKVTVKTQNGKKAVVTVVVKKKPAAPAQPEETGLDTDWTSPLPEQNPGADPSVSYRALLIGEATFQSEDDCPRNRNDVALMKRTLSRVTGLYGGRFTVAERYDLNRAQTLNAIAEVFSGADDNDVSLFFIATHGDAVSSGSAAGQLAMSPSGALSLGELARALKAVPGRIIVILEACGSGAGIYEESALYEAFEAAAIADDAAAVRAFSEADEGIAAGTDTVVPGAADAMYAGELREANKFYVLTASRYQEYSYGWEDGNGYGYNFFTKWLTDGVGLSGSMPADGNGNGALTLDELYAYISRTGDNTCLGYDDWNNVYYYQHVQVYPAGCDFVLFRR